MKYVNLEKVLYMDSLIQRRSTGNPVRFAEKLELSRSALFDYLSYMKNELTLDIQYNEYNETYYYDGNDLCSMLGNVRCTVCKAKSSDES